MSDSVRVHLPTGFDGYRLATKAQHEGIDDPFLENVVRGEVSLTEGASRPDVEIDVSKINVNRLMGNDQIADLGDPEERGRRAMTRIRDAAKTSGMLDALDTPRDVDAIGARPSLGGQVRNFFAFIPGVGEKDLLKYNVNSIIPELREAVRLMQMGTAHPEVSNGPLDLGLQAVVRVVYDLRGAHEARLLGLCDDVTAGVLKTNFHELMVQIDRLKPEWIARAHLPAPSGGHYVKRDVMYALRDLSENVFGESFPEQLKAHF